MLTLGELGISKLSGWNSALSNHFLVGITDFKCNQCIQSPMLIVAASFNGSFPDGYSFLCPSCLTERRFVDLTIEHQGLLQDKFKHLQESSIKSYAEGLLKMFSMLERIVQIDGFKVYSAGGLNATKSDTSRNEALAGENEVTIPKGYRSISWIRLYEAEAIIHCYEIKSDYEYKNENGKISLICNYYADGTDESKKFRANVQVTRVNNLNRRVIGWIRLEEAKAIVKANLNRIDVEFSHVKYGNGGKVQFFLEESDVARKYRSTTRLLRKD